MRLELSNRTGLARSALLVLARDGGVTPMKGLELAKAIGTTRTYLPLVVAPIVAAGWVASEPGPTGGYRITPRAMQATMFDLIEAVEGPIDDGRCVLRGSRCDASEPCAIHDVWSRTRGVMIAELRATPAIPKSTRTAGPDLPSP